MINLIIYPAHLLALWVANSRTKGPTRGSVAM